MLSQRIQTQTGGSEEKIYFEALCVLETSASHTLDSLDKTQLIALGKISRFCKESGLQAYVIEFMCEPPASFAYSQPNPREIEVSPNHMNLKDTKSSDKRPNKLQSSIFLTKQKLIPTTGYYCKVANLSARLFGTAQVLLGNSVKRILAKSDSKFVEKFALLLEIGAVYVCKRRSQDIFNASFDHSKNSKRCSSDIYYKFTSHSAGSLTLSTHSDITLPSEVRAALNLPTTVTTAFKHMPMNTPQLVETALSLPNLLISLPSDPMPVQTYILAKIIEGNQEEGVCPIGTLTPNTSSAETTAFKTTSTTTVRGLGMVRYSSSQPQEAENPKTHHCNQSTVPLSERSTHQMSHKDSTDKRAEDKENLPPNNHNLFGFLGVKDFPLLHTTPVSRRYSDNDKPAEPLQRGSLVLASEAFHTGTSGLLRDNKSMLVLQPHGTVDSILDYSAEEQESNSKVQPNTDKESPELLSDAVLQTVEVLNSQEKKLPASKVPRRQRVDAMMEKWRLGAFRNRRYTLF